MVVPDEKGICPSAPAVILQQMQEQYVDQAQEEDLGEEEYYEDEEEYDGYEDYDAPQIGDTIVTAGQVSLHSHIELKELGLYRADRYSRSITE